MDREMGVGVHGIRSLPAITALGIWPFLQRARQFLGRVT